MKETSLKLYKVIITFPRIISPKKYIYNNSNNNSNDNNNNNNNNDNNNNIITIIINIHEDVS